MSVLQIKNCSIGEGKVKICVPIIKTTKKEIITEIDCLIQDTIDLVEWRIDFFEEITHPDAILEILAYMKHHLQNQLILVSFRSMREGGNQAISLDSYRKLLYFLIESGNVDLLDVELFSDEKMIEDVIAYAHKHQVYIICSSHEFHHTPSYEEMKKRLCHMQEIGCDIAKLAVMPQDKKDVLTLLKVSNDVHELANMCPIITMSMGKQGMITRICGEIFGSCITFAARKEQSAPGQLSLPDIDVLLSQIHESMQEDEE